MDNKQYEKKKKKRKKSEKEKDKEKEKEASYISDTITICATFIRDSVVNAGEVLQNNYYPIKESLLNAYDTYFCECTQQNNVRVNGNVPFFTIKSDNSRN
ncbi:conserved Plasmodium protein, unknown function [Plasmodium sp. gorilla clade G3]|nr:conserved Plasmodium protein, unknown function [Plasmodium sp. gorilla clade G3]